MSSPNRFQFDVVADDKASDKVDKVTGSVQRLIPVLQAANVQFKEISRSIGSIGTINFGGLAQAQVRAAEGQRRVRDTAAANARRDEAAEERAAAARLTASRAEEAAFQRKINIQHAYTAQIAREAAMAKSTSEERLAALGQEVERAKAVREVEKQRHAEAQQYAADTAIRAQSGGFENRREQAAADREAVYAARQLADAEQRVKATHQDVAAARRLVASETKAYNREVRDAAAKLEKEAKEAAAARDYEANAGRRAAIALEAEHRRIEASLSHTRYALYQTAAAYGTLSAAIIAAAAISARTAMDFEVAQSTLGRTTGLGITARAGGPQGQAAATELGMINAELIEMSRNIPVTFEDLAMIGSLGAQMGIASSQVAGFADTVAKFSATTDVATDQAAKSFGQLQNIIDVPAAQFSNLGSAVAKLGVESVSTEGEILAVATQIGAVGNNAGLSAPYVLGLATALASVRVAPELSRGAMLGIFQNISRSAAEGGEKLQAWANVMGLTSEATKEMIANNPEQFFTRFITNLGQAAERGDNLIPVLDSLGIKGRRDVPVIQRLANSYQLLGQYIGTSADAFSAGTFLDEAFAAQTDNAAAAVDRLVNSARALGAALGEPFLGPIQVVSNVLNAFLEILTNLPGAITAPLVGLIAGIGVYAAYRTAVALGTAALFAHRAAQLGLKNMTDTTTASFTGLSGVLVRHAAATLGAKRATDQLTTSQVAAAGAARVAAMANAGSATAASALNVTAVAAEKGVSRLNKALMAFTGVGLVIGIIASVASLFETAGDAAAKAAIKQKELNDEFLAAGNLGKGGTLAQAIAKDTAAFKEAGNAATAANGVYQTYSKTVLVAADGTATLQNVIKDASGNIISQTEGAKVGTVTFDNYAATLNNVAGTQMFAGKTIEDTRRELEGQTVAVGKNVDAWRRQAIIASLKESLKDPGLQNAITELGPRLSEVLNAAVSGGRTGVQAYIDDIRKQLTTVRADISRATAMGPAGATFFGDPALLAREKQLKDLIALLEVFAEKGQTGIDTLNQEAGGNQALNDIITALGGVIEGFEETGDAADIANEKIDAALKKYNSFVEAVTAPLTLEAGILDAFHKLGESIGENGPDFSQYTEAGRANLEAFMSVIDAFDAYQQDAIQRNELTAEQAMANMQVFVSNLMTDLSGMQVDTTALDALEARIISLVNSNPTIAVNTDVSAAMSNLNSLQSVLAGIKDSHLAGTSLFTAFMPSTPTPPVAQTPQLRTAIGSMNRAALGQQLVAGRAKAAAEAAEKAGKAAGKANDTAADAAERHASWLKEIAGYYDKLGTSMLAGIAAEGATFAALDALGKSIAENGRGFNTVTEEGRKNFDALAGALDAYGNTLSASIESGTISVGQAGAKYRQFARGLYSELVAVGVPVQALSGMFRALGVDASGWAGSSAEIAQYAGRITEAANATADFIVETTDAERWADKLGDAFSRITARQYGLGDAIDSVQSAMNQLRQSYQDSIDKAEELRRANEKLSGDLGLATTDKRKAEIEQAISIRYGETDRAADYGAQAAEAQARINDIRAQIEANAKERAELEAGRNALDGYSDAAIDNRKALSDLQRQIMEQIVAYARTGATTQQVTAYTDQMSREFIDAARSAGFTDAQIQRYTGTFRVYAQAIQAIPRTVDITTTNTTYAVVDPNSYWATRYAIDQIPKQQHVAVTPYVTPGSIGAVNAQLGQITSNISPYMSIVTGVGKALADLFKPEGVFGQMMRGIGTAIFGRAEGGLIPGYSVGGSVIGPAPINPRRDNLIARGPDGGMVGLQGGEFIHQRSAVQKYGISFMSMINSGKLEVGRGYAAGSASHSGGSLMVELSPYDRGLLERLPERMPKGDFYVDGQRLATATSRNNVRLAGRGSN